jgi:molybdate transport repressor ModE-like protein
MDMAYSKAWTILREAERGLGFKLLHSTTGGRGGGGAVLTEQGERLLTAYDLCEQELKEAAERLFARHLAPFAVPDGPEAGKEL